ncbi:MAG: DUF3048 domain-containing protein, partial [Actinomycetota bacterium]
MSSRRTKVAIGVYVIVALLAAAVAYLLFTRDDDPAPEPAAPAPGAPWPLTGIASEPGAPLDRPGVAVKVSNGEPARPQAGINQADQVWEEQVEGISRLIAVFHSTDAAPVGPVRSARDSDVDLLEAFGTPVFVWGGANEGVAARVEASPLVSFNVDPEAAPDKYRDDQRPAPDNLFIDGTGPFFAASGATPPVAQFAYRAEGAAAPGEPTPGAEIDWGGSLVSYVWDEGRAGWARVQDGTAHVDAAGEQVAPANVVVILTEYEAAPSDPRSPVAVTVGEGEATVFTDGRQVAARWSRSSVGAPYAVVDAATGEPVGLTPG